MIPILKPILSYRYMSNCYQNLVQDSNQTNTDNRNQGLGTRNKEKYKVGHANTDRLKHSAVHYLQRLLNSNQWKQIHVEKTFGFWSYNNLNLKTVHFCNLLYHCWRRKNLSLSLNQYQPISNEYLYTDMYIGISNLYRYLYQY